jgi:hypothetical protein
MMKRVMSAPVGASRATQQQSGNANSGASIGTAAFHPRSPNVALDPVRHTMLSFCRILRCLTSIYHQFQPGGGARGGSGGGSASIYGKVPGSASGIRDRSGTGGAGRGR